MVKNVDCLGSCPLYTVCKEQPPELRHDAQEARGSLSLTRLKLDGMDTTNIGSALDSIVVSRTLYVNFGDDPRLNGLHSALAAQNTERVAREAEIVGQTLAIANQLETRVSRLEADANLMDVFTTMVESTGCKPPSRLQQLLGRMGIINHDYPCPVPDAIYNDAQSLLAKYPEA